MSKRGRSILYGVVTGGLSKGVGVLVSFLTVPIVIAHLGGGAYGSWVVIISVISWLGLSDFGIANSLVPLLVKSNSEGDFEKARSYVATAFFGLIVLSICLGGGFAFFWRFFDFSLIFNSPDKSVVDAASHALGFAVAIFLLSLPLSIVQRIYLATHQGSISNFWQVFSGVAGALGIFIGVLVDGGLEQLILLYCGFQFFVLVINSFYLFFKISPGLSPFSGFPDKFYWGEVFGVGWLFFLNQIASLVVFQKDNILVSHYYGVEQTADYSLVWQIFVYLNFVNLIVAPYVGPGFGEAYVKKNYKWMISVVRFYVGAAIFISLPFVLAFVFYYKQIILFWANRDVIIDPLVPISMGAWVLVMSFQWPIISLLNGIGRIKVVTIFYVLSAIINIPLSMFLLKNFGVYGSVLSSVVVIFIVVLWPSLRELKQVLEDAREG
ncbi:MAG: polysaccharide biosynthesis protein [Proteobacteria bacterium]|nr:polysaccharide biosynthesis protein [Pseudomonadota bacterium]